MSAVLYVGEDLCRQIPFMEDGGISVFRSERSAVKVVAAIRANSRFDAIAFEHHTFPLPPGMISAARRRSDSPLVLFENPNILTYYGVDHEKDAFDLIIPALTPPPVWLKSLRALIAEGWNLQAASKELHTELARVRSRSRALVRSSKVLRRSPIDVNALWCGEARDGKESPPPDSRNKKR